MDPSAAGDQTSAAWNIYEFEIPLLLIGSVTAVALRDHACHVMKKLTTFSSPIVDVEQIAQPLVELQSKCPSYFPLYKYLKRAIEQVHRNAGFAEGVDIKLYYKMIKYVPVVAEAIEVSPGGQLAYAEKGVRKIRYGEDGEINKESSSTCCAICLEEFVEGEVAVRLTCSYVLHGMCLERWFHRKHQCPLFRREIMWHFAMD